jgi:hypothetical protein
VSSFKGTFPLLRVGSVRASIDPNEIRSDCFPVGTPEYCRYPTCSACATAVPAVSRFVRSFFSHSFLLFLCSCFPFYIFSLSSWFVYPFFCFSLYFLFLLFLLCKYVARVVTAHLSVCIDG